MTVRIPTELRKQHGSFLSAGEPLVFHCHHYNVALQKTIEECLPDDCVPLLTDAATEVVAAQLAHILASNPQLQGFAARLQLAAELSRIQGFGLLQIEGDASGGRAVALRSHYSHGWLIKHGPRSQPTCWFHAGYLAAAFSAAAGTPPGSFEAVEVECAAAHGKRCVFEIRKSSRPIRPSVGEGRLPQLLAPPVGPTGNIQSQAITDAVLTLPLEGNEEGLIPAFGVYLTRHYANYYNRISYQFEQQLAQLDTSLLEPARLALVEAGHRCAFNTFGGITQSAEWDGLILPMCRDRSDWFYGIVACVNAFGWGCWRPVELVPGERAVVDIFGSYESSGRLAMYGQTDQGSCHLHNGGVAGLMNLLWVGDLTSRPVLDNAYYNSLYSASESFVGEEIRCRSRGDDRCTIVATRKRFA
jgi:hypothetical protein